MATPSQVEANEALTRLLGAENQERLDATVSLQDDGGTLQKVTVFWECPDPMHGRDRKQGRAKQIGFEACLQNLAGALIDGHANCRAPCAVPLPSEGLTKRRPSPSLLEQMREKKTKTDEKTDKIAALKKDCNELKRQKGFKLELSKKDIEKKSVAVDYENVNDFDSETELDATPSAAARQRKSRAMEHETKGLVGWVKYWARGSVRRVVLLIVSLVTMFEVKDQVLAELGMADAAVEKYVCNRLTGALEILKNCSNESMRQDYHVVLASIAPDPTDRFSTAIANRLNISQFSHPKDPFVQSRTRRAIIDAMINKNLTDGLQVGDKVTCNHGSGILKSYNGDSGQCSVEIDVDGHKQTFLYDNPGNKARADKGKPGRGGGRVRWAAPTFRPPPRASRADSISAATKTLITEFYEANCATSPCERDQLRRRIGPGQYIYARLMIMLSTYSELYAEFKAEHPGVDVGYGSFHRLRPWNLRKAKHQCCLCRICENYDLYFAGLKAACKILCEEAAEPLVGAGNNS